ncbi:MAG: hypothetical protein H7175_23985 [Burkholderiales bacterium]|nr:hypothetical protein [Anaerolineae bacterium]
MTILPVREMVLYKHGVGFFVRAGAVSGVDVTLTFRHDEINDVLKSLTAFDNAGGQVLGIHYQTPMDINARLANSSIRLSDTASARDLLRDLRGRKVTLTFEITPGTLETITGRMIGIDEPQKEQMLTSDPFGISLVTMAADDGSVRVYKLGGLRGFTIHDAQSQSDLQYFLDTSMAQDSRRSVMLRLSPGEHDLNVYYVAPSPTWRVSYRVVAETDENAETGKALLQGWGLFDNRLEEDLENIHVTLVAGQPISFIYDLYTSRIPQRSTVKDESRVAPGPVEYDAAYSELADMPDFLMSADLADEEDRTVGQQMAKRSMPAAANLFGGGHSEGIVASRSLRAEIAAQQSAQTTAATGKEAGEFFQYEVTAPVSVKRGESALVPIVGADVSYSRELLYNGSKFAKHPVAALRFKNSTGLTLERGPVTVVENGDYEGEAIVPFTKDGSEVYLPYAVELGVRISESPTAISTEISALNVKGAYLIVDEYQISGIKYSIENTSAKPLTILIEANKPVGPTPSELFETRPPDVETATEWRWRVNIAARSRTEFIRQMRRRTQRREEVRRLDYRRLQNFMDNRYLDTTTYERLSELLDKLAFQQSAQAEIHKLETERGNMYGQQEQARANLQALNPSGQEADLRKRMLRQLETAQDRLEAIEQRINELTQQIADAEARVLQIITELE